MGGLLDTSDGELRARKHAEQFLVWLNARLAIEQLIERRDNE